MPGKPVLFNTLDTISAGSEKFITKRESMVSNSPFIKSSLRARTPATAKSVKISIWNAACVKTSMIRTTSPFTRPNFAYTWTPSSKRANNALPAAVRRTRRVRRVLCATCTMHAQNNAEDAAHKARSRSRYRTETRCRWKTYIRSRCKTYIRSRYRTETRSRCETRKNSLFTQQKDTATAMSLLRVVITLVWANFTQSFVQ